MCGFLVDTGSRLPIEDVKVMAQKIAHRGPDDSAVWSRNHVHFFFHRLAIMDQSELGRQPFVLDGDLVLVCNGEVYNEPELKKTCAGTYTFQSRSDCEILLPMYREFGVKDMSLQLEAEFSLVGYDLKQGTFFASRDPMGIRPLFYGYAEKTGSMIFASEVKALQGICRDIQAFPPGHYYRSDTGLIQPYRDVANPFGFSDGIGTREINVACEGIKTLLEKAVEKRLRSDVPVGFMLSGGLDSSLVCAIASKMDSIPKPITTFAIGIDEDPIDIHYARTVAEYLGTDHHEILFSKSRVFEALPHVIRHIESWDVTTVRASIGMYLLCEYIKKNTDIRVVMTGEVSDELFGYKYTDFAPDAEAFQGEARKRIKELYCYDVLRADRCISAHGLEARVPFSDTDFVEWVMSISPELKVNHTGIGKFLLRKAFDTGDYLPNPILYREKAAFSDAVGHSMVDELKKRAGELYNEAELKRGRNQYTSGVPYSFEALWYRDIFEAQFPGLGGLIPGYWMPNPRWEHCSVMDPSARALPNYGNSGSTSERDLDRRMAV